MTTVSINPQKAAKVTMYIVIAVVIFFVAFFIISAFKGGIKWIKNLFGLETDEDEDEAKDNIDAVYKPTEYNPNGGAVTGDFDADFYVTRLNDVLNDWGQMSPWATDRCKTVTEVNQLNDNQIIAIANRYYAVIQKRLYKDLEEVWTSGCDFANPTKELRERLTKLKLR